MEIRKIYEELTNDNKMLDKYTKNRNYKQERID